MVFVMSFIIVLLCVCGLGINIFFNRKKIIQKCDKTGGICGCL